MKPNQPAPAAAPGADAGAVDVAPIIADASSKVPPQFKPMFDKVVLSGMRIMFDKSSHGMMTDALDKPGPLAKRLSDGIISLMYLMWRQSNHTIPPQTIIPAALVLTLKAFEFVQLSKDPEATKETLGEATHLAIQGIMDRFGATEDKLPHLLKGTDPGTSMGPGNPPGAMPTAPGGKMDPNSPPPGGGMLDNAMGAQ